MVRIKIEITKWYINMPKGDAKEEIITFRNVERISNYPIWKELYE